MNYEMFHQLSFIDEGQKGQHSLNGGNVGASALMWALFLYGLAEDDALTVEDVVVQSSKRNIYGRSVRLDALCTLGDGSKSNVEVQRADDGVHEVYVNTKVKDGSRISELMDCFTEKKVENQSFPATTKRLRELKETEGGASAVCDDSQSRRNDSDSFKHYC